MNINGNLSQTASVTGAQEFLADFAIDNLDFAAPVSAAFTYCG